MAEQEAIDGGDYRADEGEPEHAPSQVESEQVVQEPEEPEAETVPDE